jgi:hypothetical protein
MQQEEWIIKYYESKSDNPAAGTYKIIVTGTTVPLNTQEFSVVYDYVVQNYF